MKSSNLMQFETAVDARIAISMSEVMDAIKYWKLNVVEKSKAIKYWVDHRGN